MSITVSTTAALQAALKSAAAGAVIALAPGAYPEPSIVGVSFAQPVTITSADPTNPAVLDGLKVANSAGLIFSGLELSSVGNTDLYYAFRITNAQNLVFTGLNVHGDVTAAPSTQLWGFYVIGCTGVAFTFNRFHREWAGITANNNVDLTVSHNSFTELDKGGFEGGADQNLTITDNDFTDFIVAAGTHADAIQVYTAGTTVASSNLDIEGNLYWRGAGDVLQGVFVQDEVGTLPFNGVTIKSNAMIGGMTDAIYLDHATGAIDIEDNIAVSWLGLNKEGDGTPAAAQATTFATTNFQSYLWLRGDFTGATLTEKGNIAQAYPAPAGGNMATPAGNVLAGAIADQGAAMLYAWLAGQPGREVSAP